MLSLVNTNAEIIAMKVEKSLMTSVLALKFDKCSRVLVSGVFSSQYECQYAIVQRVCELFDTFSDAVKVLIRSNDDLPVA